MELAFERAEKPLMQYKTLLNSDAFIYENVIHVKVDDQVALALWDMKTNKSNSRVNDTMNGESMVQLVGLILQVRELV